MPTVSAADGPGGPCPDGPGGPCPDEVGVPLHLGVLADLALEVGPPIAARFVQRFLDMLEPRVTSLLDATHREDAEAAHVAALSLHSSASMVGATALAETAATMVGPLRRGDVRPAAAALPALTQQAQVVHRALLAALD